MTSPNLSCPVCNYTASDPADLDNHLQVSGHVKREEVPLATSTQTPAYTSNTREDWVDDTDNPAVDASTVELADEQGFEGDAPNPEIVEGKDTLEQAQELGLHDTDEEHPDEVGVAEEVNYTEALKKPS